MDPSDPGYTGFNKFFHQRKLADPSFTAFRSPNFDTLYSIAKKNNVDVNQLRTMNGLKDNNVKLGQTLKVSAR